MANPTTKQPNANKCLDVHESRKFLKECRNTNNEDITPQKVFEIVRVISVQSRQALSVAQYQIRKYVSTTFSYILISSSIVCQFNGKEMLQNQ